jgi:hypothetical protein
MTVKRGSPPKLHDDPDILPGARSRRIDPDLDPELDRGSKTLRLAQDRAGDLESLAAYCQRINDSGH